MKSTKNSLVEILKSSLSETEAEKSESCDCCAHLGFPAPLSVEKIWPKFAKAFPELDLASTDRFDEFPAVEALFEGYSIALLGPSNELESNDHNDGVQLQILPLKSRQRPVNVSAALAAHLRRLLDVECRPLE